MNNNDFNFCVWSMNGDFLETFKTLKEAFLYCKRHYFNGLIVGRWDRDENSNYLDSYTPIKNYPAFNYELKMGYHCNGVTLEKVLKDLSVNYPLSTVLLFHCNSLLWEHSIKDAINSRGAKTINNFFVTHYKGKNCICISHYKNNYKRV